MSAEGVETAGKAWRPCCGVCRMTSLLRQEPPADIVCLACGAKWDGSEVTPDKLPEMLEENIRAGHCTREEAYAAFLHMDDLAEAAAKREITYEQGLELVKQGAFKTVGKARPQ